MSRYIEAKKKCLEALWEFRCDINDLLPDTAGGDDYYTGWTSEDCEYVQRCIDRTVGVILSTCMYDHVAQEMWQIKNDYEAAIKEKDIRKCQLALNKAMEEFAIVHTCCKAIKEDM